MLDRLLAVCTYGAASAPQVVYGAFPPEVSVDQLDDMRDGKATVRRIADRLVLMAPAGAERWACWLFDHVPAVTELPGLIKNVQSLSWALLPDNANAPPSVGGAVEFLIPKLAGVRRPSRGALLQMVANAIVEAGLASRAVVAPCGSRKVGRIWTSDQRLLSATDEVRHVLSRTRGSEPVSTTSDHLSGDADGLDHDLLADMVNEEQTLLDIPATGETGYAFLLFRPANGAAKDLSRLRELIGFARGEEKKTRVGVRRFAVRTALLAALAVLGVYLFSPAPLRITATATSSAANGVVAGLPFDAFLEHVEVDVGETVKEGDLLATFSAPSQEEQRAEAEFALTSEEIAAQSALAENDYGSYVLAEQRIETNRRRLDQIETRIDRLNLTAPTDGRVISTIGRNLTGRFVPVGQEVAVVQASDAFDITLTVSRVDAPLVEPGQTGEIYFRGLPAQSYRFTVLTPVTMYRDAETDQRTLSARARIEADPAGRLSVGLAGFAKLDVGRDLRIKSMSRYVIEFARVKAWSYLGLRF